MKKQIINPYIRYGRTAQGLYAHNIGSGAHGRAVTIGEVDTSPRVIRAYIPATTSDAVVVVFNGVPTATSLLTGVSYSVNGIGGGTFDSVTVNGNEATYSDRGEGSLFEPGDVVRWIYTPGDILIDGEPLDAQDVLVDNQLKPAPVYVSGRIYENVGVQYIEITFNTAMTYLGFAGVTVKADGDVRGITAISGDRTTKITYTVNGFNPANVATWEYSEAAGSLENISGALLPDVTPQTLTNELPSQTLWDYVAPDPQTYWDGNPPAETKWDLE